MVYLTVLAPVTRGLDHQKDKYGESDKGAAQHTSSIPASFARRALLPYPYILLQMSPCFQLHTSQTSPKAGLPLGTSIFLNTWSPWVFPKWGFLRVESCALHMLGLSLVMARGTEKVGSGTSAHLPSFPPLCVPSVSPSTSLSLLAGCLPHGCPQEMSQRWSHGDTPGGHNCQHWQGELSCQEVPAVASWCSTLQGCHRDAPHVPSPALTRSSPDGADGGLLVLGGDTGGQGDSQN